jgi:hypothetical protein
LFYVRNLFKSRTGTSFYEEKKIGRVNDDILEYFGLSLLKIFTVDFLHQPLEKKKPTIKRKTKDKNRINGNDGGRLKSF